jgi:DNA-binding transcriptional MocR family regulator
MTLQLLTYAEQVARHLRGELTRGRWLHVLPGIKHLGRELGVNHSTMEAALRLLEACSQPKGMACHAGSLPPWNPANHAPCG